MDKLIKKSLPKCSICLHPIGHRTKKKLSCNHIYHWRCIDKWTKINNSCPLCRDIQCKECKNRDDVKDDDSDDDNNQDSLYLEIHTNSFTITPDDLIIYLSSLNNSAYDSAPN